MDENLEMLLIKFSARASATFNRLAKALAALEVPINLLPSDIEGDSQDLIASVRLGREALAELPMDTDIRGVLMTGMADWLTAMALVMMAGSPEGESWMFEAGLLATYRVDQALDIAQGLVDGDIEVLGRTEEE